MFVHGFKLFATHLPDPCLICGTASLFGGELSGADVQTLLYMLKFGFTDVPAFMVHGCKVNPLIWSVFGWSRTDLAFC